jgi:hypothetical protein
MNAYRMPVTMITAATPTTSSVLKNSCIRVALVAVRGETSASEIEIRVTTETLSLLKFISNNTVLFIYIHGPHRPFSTSKTNK